MTIPEKPDQLPHISLPVQQSVTKKQTLLPHLVQLLKGEKELPPAFAQLQKSLQTRPKNRVPLSQHPQILLSEAINSRDFKTLSFELRTALKIAEANLLSLPVQPIHIEIQEALLDFQHSCLSLPFDVRQKTVQAAANMRQEIEKAQTDTSLSQAVTKGLSTIEKSIEQAQKSFLFPLFTNLQAKLHSLLEKSPPMPSPAKTAPKHRSPKHLEQRARRLLSEATSHKGLSTKEAAKKASKKALSLKNISLTLTREHRYETERAQTIEGWAQVADKISAELQRAAEGKRFVRGLDPNSPTITKLAFAKRNALLKAQSALRTASDMLEKTQDGLFEESKDAALKELEQIRSLSQKAAKQAQDTLKQTAQFCTKAPRHAPLLEITQQVTAQIQALDKETSHMLEQVKKILMA